MIERIKVEAASGLLPTTPELKGHLICHSATTTRQNICSEPHHHGPHEVDDVDNFNGANGVDEDDVADDVDDVDDVAGLLRNADSVHRSEFFFFLLTLNDSSRFLISISCQFSPFLGPRFRQIQ